MEQLRVVVVNKGEDKITAASRILKTKLNDGIETMKKDLAELYPDNSITENYYSTEKEKILQKLESSLIRRNYKKYKDSSLSEKGGLQAFYSGKMLNAYFKQNNLESAKLAFSSPFESTVGSLKEVLKSSEDAEPEIVIIYSMEGIGEYKINNNLGSYQVMYDEISLQDLSVEESNLKEVDRFKKGLEKVFKKNKEASEEGLPIIMVNGSVLEKSSKVFLNENIHHIKDSAVYDITISFDANGKFVTAKVNAEIKMDTRLETVYTNELKKLKTFQCDNDVKYLLNKIPDKLNVLKHNTVLKINTEKHTKTWFQHILSLLNQKKSFSQKPTLENQSEFLNEIQNYDVFGFFDGLKAAIEEKKVREVHFDDKKVSPKVTKNGNTKTTTVSSSARNIS